MKCFPIALGAVLCACLALLTPSAAVYAEDEPNLPPTSQFFDEYDTNSDGKVMAAEFRGAAEVFKLLDEDGDGAITPTELGLPADFRPDPKRKRPTAGREAPAGNRARKARERMEQLLAKLKAMDTNGDGKITKDEWKGPEEVFGRLDRNKDGVIDAQDRAARGAGAGRPGKGRGGKGQPGGDRRPDPAQLAERVKKQAAKQFKKLDANADGRLTGDEVPHPKLLEAADGDKDGAVTLEEMQRAALARAQQRAGGKGKRRGDQDGEDTPRKARGPRITNATLKRWDRDGDEKVSADEFPGGDETFARLDVDKDGYITSADLKALKKQQRKRQKKDGDAAPSDKPQPARSDLIQRMDKDGDGRLHRGEFKGPQEMWQRLDKNQDGWITADEVKAGD